jgi:hypothetical protein
MMIRGGISVRECPLNDGNGLADVASVLEDEYRAVEQEEYIHAIRGARWPRLGV